MEKNEYAKAWWTVDDVTELADDLGLKVSADHAKEILRREENRIMDAMSVAGWDVIQSALLNGEHSDVGSYNVD